MHKIDSPNATGANEFTDGDAAQGVLATVLWSKWLNSLQRELIAVLTAAGITPSEANDAQVLAAIGVLISNHNATYAVHGATSAATAQRIILRDAAGRAKVVAPAASDDIARLDSITLARLGISATAAQIMALVNGITSNFIREEDDVQTASVTAPGSHAVLSLTTPVVNGDVGVLQAEYRLNLDTGSGGLLRVGPTLAATGVNFLGEDGAYGVDASVFNTEAIYCRSGFSGGYCTQRISAHFRVTSTNASRVFTLYRRETSIDSGISVASQLHKMTIKWLYKQ